MMGFIHPPNSLIINDIVVIGVQFMSGSVAKSTPPQAGEQDAHQTTESAEVRHATESAVETQTTEAAEPLQKTESAIDHHTKESEIQTTESERALSDAPQTTELPQTTEESHTTESPFAAEITES